MSTPSRAGERNIVAVDSAIEYRREHTVIIDAQPRAAGAQITTGDDPWLVPEQARGRRWTIVLLISIGGDEYREIRQDAEINRQCTHGLRFTECSVFCKPRGSIDCRRGAIMLASENWEG